ncbi:unnamed protein product [Amaranthus hypochondriacus]
MGIYNLTSEDLFLRSAGKSQVMVVKLTKDVHSAIVETKDWKVEETIGSNLTYDTLQISGNKITGQDLKKLATNLCESRLWVNKDGINFSRLTVTSLSFLVILFYQTKNSFDWSQFGVKNNDGPNNPDEKIKELMNEVKNKTAEIARFNAFNYSSYSWNNPPDLSSMPTYRPVDEIVINRYPSGINVYVNDGSFQKDNWSFIKIKDENQGFESLFAFYRGVYDSTTTYYGNHRVNIPYSSSATLQANVRFLAVTLRGYGPAFGFCYTR